jgi:hypothetical protein
LHKRIRSGGSLWSHLAIIRTPSHQQDITTPEIADPILFQYQSEIQTPEKGQAWRRTAETGWTILGGDHQ